MNRLLTLLLLQLTILSASAQDISRHQADSLLALLSKTHSTQDRIPALLQLAQFHIFKPGEYKSDLDSAFNLVAQAKQTPNLTTSQNANILLTESFLLRDQGQKATAKQKVLQVIPMAQTDKALLGKAYEALTTYYDYQQADQLPEMIRLTQMAIQAFDQAGNKERLAFNLKYLADLYDNQNDNPNAMKTLEKALKVYQSIGYQQLQSVYALYSSLYNNTGDFRQALNYILMALKSAQKTGDTSINLCQINNRAGLTLKHLNEVEKSITYFKAALAVAKKYNDNNAALTVTTNIVYNYVELKRPQEALDFLESVPKSLLEPRSDESYFFGPFNYLTIYCALKNGPQIELYKKKILDIIKQHHSSIFLQLNYNITLAKYYLETKQYDIARTYYPKVDSLSKKTGDPVWIRNSYHFAFWLDSADGKYKAAVTDLLNYNKIKDSLFTETSNRQIKTLELEYETEKNQQELALKDRDISALNQKNQLQQSNLRQAAMIRNITFGVIGLLIIILWLIYRQFRFKQENNNTISYKNNLLEGLLQEKEWLLKEIHHRVKNNFQTVMGLLGTQSGYLKNKAAIEAIRNSQHRIHAMSLIHQKLYQTDNLSAIDMPGYIHELVDYLSDSFNPAHKIRFRMEIQSLEMDLSHCIPVGLILNETITNSFKYAFPEGREGIIDITLTTTAKDRWLLAISDDGVGLPQDFNEKRTDSMGMNLMKGLSNEIGATFTISSHEGTRITISFEYPQEPFDRQHI